LEEVVERAVEAKLHNYRLPGRRRFSKRAFKLTREAFKSAAWKVEGGVDGGGVCPQLVFDGADLRRLAQHEFAEREIPEGTISSDITLINELADTEEARTWFTSPLLNTSRGLRQVRLFLRSERTEHAYSFEVLDERDRVLVKRITKEVRVGQALEDMWVDQVLRNRRLKLRLREALVSMLLILGLTLTYAALPTQAQEAIKRFGREKILEPLKRLFTGDGAPAGSSLDVQEDRDAPKVQLLEERVRLRFTPSMYWSAGGASSASGACVENAPMNRVQLTAPEIHTPPFVVVRNGVIIRDNVTDHEIRFDDRDVLPGRAYTYMIGKRDAAAGDVMIGTMVGTATPLCPKPARSSNRPPALAVTVDRETGPAPLKATFKITLFDDEERVRPFVIDFGDGTDMVASNSPQIAHEYRYGGTYTAKVIFTDTADNKGEALSTVSVEGPPPPPPLPGVSDPWELWHPGYHATADPVVGYIDQPFTIVVHPEYMMTHYPMLPVASYYWLWGDCLGSKAASTADHKNCMVGPFKEPKITRRFDKPGSYDVGVYMTYENGDVKNLQLGSVTVLPSEKWLAEHPVNPHARMHYDQMLEAARYYAPKHGGLTTSR
jgi:hypothetical protein